MRSRSYAPTGVQTFPGGVTTYCSGRDNQLGHVPTSQPKYRRFQILTLLPTRLEIHMLGWGHFFIETMLII